MLLKPSLARELVAERRSKVILDCEYLESDSVTESTAWWL